MERAQLHCNGAVSYTQRWKYKLAEVVWDVEQDHQTAAMALRSNISKQYLCSALSVWPTRLICMLSKLKNIGRIKSRGAFWLGKYHVFIGAHSR